MSLITPENIAGVMTGTGAILSAVGGWALWRGRKEPSPPGTVNGAKEALAENTVALREMQKEFHDNNLLFTEIILVVHAMASDIAASREHLSAIRDGARRR